MDSPSQDNGYESANRWLALDPKCEQIFVSCNNLDHILQGMSDQSKRGVRLIGAAIIVAALVVSASVLFASSYGLGGTRTVTKTVISASMTTNLITTTTTSTEAPASIRLHEVAFNESGECGAYASTWAVTLGNITIAQPSNATLPISTEEGVAGGA